MRKWKQGAGPPTTFVISERPWRLKRWAKARYQNLANRVHQAVQRTRGQHDKSVVLGGREGQNAGKREHPQKGAGGRCPDFRALLAFYSHVSNPFVPPPPPPPPNFS